MVNVMTVTNNSKSRQGDDNPIVWQAGGQDSGTPSVYVYLEQIGRATSRSEEVIAAGDRLSIFINRNLVHTTTPENARNPYTQVLNRIWREIVPSRLKPSTHLIEVGFKLREKPPEPFLRVPVRLIDPRSKRLVDVQEVVNYVRSAVETETFRDLKTLPIPLDLKHAYTLIVLEALFVGWINERGLVDVVVHAASQPLFKLRTLTDRD